MSFLTTASHIIQPSLLYNSTCWLYICYIITVVNGCTRNYLIFLLSLSLQIVVTYLLITGKICAFVTVDMGNAGKLVRFVHYYV